MVKHICKCGKEKHWVDSKACVPSLKGFVKQYNQEFLDYMMFHREASIETFKMTGLSFSQMHFSYVEHVFHPIGLTLLFVFIS